MKKLLFLISLFFLASLCSGATYYTATNGNDSNPGTIGEPFRTIKKGLDTLAANDVDGGDTLYIRGGIYYEEVRITNTIVGTAGDNVYVSNYQDEVVIMDGGEPITTWTQCTADEAGVKNAGVLPPDWASFYDQVYKASIPADSKIFMGGSLGYASTYGVQLALGGERKERAGCTTEHDVPMFPDLESGDGWDIDSASTTTTIVDTENLTQAQTNYWNGAGVWVMEAGGSYGICRRVTAFNPSTDTLTLNASASIRETENYYLDNHTHFFSTTGPGSYTFTPTATNGYYTVYYYKEASESEADLENVTTGMRYSSKTAAIRLQTDVNYLHINGITVRNYQGRRGKDFYGNTYGSAGSSGGGIVSSEGIARNITITNCNFYNLYDYNSGAAIGLADCREDFIIENCDIENIGFGGFGIDLPSELVGGGPLIVRNCNIFGVYSTNIRPRHFTNIEISHNTISHNDGIHGNGCSLYADNTNALFAHNIVIHGSNSLTLQDIKNVFVFGNVFMAKDTSGTLALWDNTNRSYARGLLYILQNSIFAETSTSPQPQALGIAGQRTTPTLKITIKNNIIDGCKASLEDWNINNISDSYNYYMRNSGVFPQYPLGTTDVGDYDSSGSFTKHVAQFVNFHADDFRLDASNKGINEGGNLDAQISVMQGYFPSYNFSVDLQGIPWDSPASCGAYEYSDSPDPPDSTPPTPNPATWSVTPAEVDSDSITMTATTGTDAESPPVEYYFEEVSGNSGATDSGWQASATYQDDGLTEGLIYQYRVKMRNSIGGETSWSTTENGYIEPAAPDTTAPTPDPMTWESVPAVIDGEMQMTASEATDAETSPVQYYFTCTTDNAFDSGWLDVRSYKPIGLEYSTEYTFTVKARDSVYPTSNETAASSAESDTTDAAPEVINYFLGGGS